jgi:hypothetical protein
MSARSIKKDYSDWSERAGPISWENACTLLSLYVDEWEEGGDPPLDWPVLKLLVRHAGGEELADMVRKSANAKAAVANHRTNLFRLASDHPNAIPVLFAIDDDKDITSFWVAHLVEIPAAARVEGLKAIVREDVRLFGREKTRTELTDIWRAPGILEEEKEALLEAAVGQHLYEWNTLPSLGPDAQPIAQRLLARGRIRAENLGRFFAGAAPGIKGTQPCPDWLSDRVQSLAQRVNVPLRLGGCGLKPEELARLQLASFHPILALMAIREYRHLEEVLRHLSHEWPPLLYLGLAGPGVHPNLQTLGVPLIRLLHMRRLLDTPILASSLANPEATFRPDAFLEMLQADAVTYSPEMRLPAGAERGWRRRWAESTGESLSCLFMEDSLAIDMTTLVRIVESTKEKTPDFLAKTFAGEHIVFEAKGATTWKTFGRSKLKALKQLAKTGASRKWQQAIGWNQGAKGRSFACCLFAACDGAVEFSQFHVEDPPFAFERFFHEGWENEARRWHYAAVLQAAGLWGDAAELLRRPSPEMPHGEPGTFRLVLTEEVAKDFAGTYWAPADAARALGHPQADAFRAVRVFTGIEADTRALLQRGRFPPARPFGPRTPEPEGSQESYSPIPQFGLLLGRERKGPPRGVFSRMSDGAFLAVEME